MFGWRFVSAVKLVAGGSVVLAGGISMVHDLRQTFTNTLQVVHCVDPKDTIDQNLMRSLSPRGQELHKYYVGYVNIASAEIDQMKQKVTQIQTAVLPAHDVITTNIQVEPIKLELNSVQNVGSTEEGLKVISPDEFDLSINFQFSNVEPGDLSVKDSVAPGYKYIEIRRQNQWWHLSPQTVLDEFEAHVKQKISQNRDLSDIKVYKRGPAIRAVIADPVPDMKSLWLDFVPTLQLNDRYFVAKPHWQRDQKNEYKDLWRESFSTRELSELNALDESTSCHKACLQIAKAIIYNNTSQFVMISSYVFKTILLNMMNEKPKRDWSWENLEERMDEFFIRLSNCNNCGELPHRYVKDLNLLEGSAEKQSRCNDFVKQLCGFKDEQKCRQAAEDLCKASQYGIECQKFADLICPMTSRPTEICVTHGENHCRIAYQNYDQRFNDFLRRYNSHEIHELLMHKKRH